MDIMSFALFAIALCAVAFAARPHAFSLRLCATTGAKQGNPAVQGTTVPSVGYLACTPFFGTAASGTSTVLVDRPRTNDVAYPLGGC